MRELLSIAGSGPGRRRENGRLSREDSMAASGPSQAKHTAKESSGEERRGESGRREEKESGTLAKTGEGETAMT